MNIFILLYTMLDCFNTMFECFYLFLCDLLMLPCDPLRPKVNCDTVNKNNQLQQMINHLQVKRIATPLNIYRHHWSLTGKGGSHRERSTPAIRGQFQILRRFCPCRFFSGSYVLGPSLAGCRPLSTSYRICCRCSSGNVFAVFNFGGISSLTILYPTLHRFLLWAEYA